MSGIERCEMSLKAPDRAIESLQLTLTRLEENIYAVADPSTLNELKRLILLRIADLEAEQAIEKVTVLTLRSDDHKDSEPVGPSEPDNSGPIAA